MNETVIPDPVASADSPEPVEPAGAYPPILEDPAAAPVRPAEPYAPANIPTLDILQDIGAAAPSAPVKRRGKNGLAIIGGAAVVVIVLIVLVVKLLSGMFGGGGRASYVYLNDDGELMYLADLKEKTQALELSDEANTYANVQFSPDGKTVYFREADNTLYRIAVAELKKGGKPERVAREVGYYSVLKDGRLIYIQYDSSDGNKLYLYDGEESTRLLRGYYRYQLSEDQKTLYYTERDDTNYTLALYRLDLTKSDAQAERLLKGADYIYTDYDASLLVYGVEELSFITVYSCVPGGDKTKLVSGAYSVSDVTVSGGKADFYFELLGTDYGQTSVSIYHYTNGDKGSAIATKVNPYGFRVSANGIFLYRKLDDNEQWYQNVGGKESKIDLDDVTSIYGLHVLNDKELVLDVYDGYDESLRSFSIGKDSLTFVSTIIEDDFSGPYQGTSSGSDVLYLFTDVVYDSKGTLADFCVYRNGKLETIAKEVYEVAVLDSSGTTYAVTDINSWNGSGELAMVKDGKMTTINDEVSGEAEPIFLDSAQVLYLSDDDLMLWNGKENRRIARDVMYVWASIREKYTTYGG